MNAFRFAALAAVMLFAIPSASQAQYSLPAYEYKVEVEVWNFGPSLSQRYVTFFSSTSYAEAHEVQDYLKFLLKRDPAKLHDLLNLSYYEAPMSTRVRKVSLVNLAIPYTWNGR